MTFLRRELGNGSLLAYGRSSICLDIKGTEEESVLEGNSITSSISFISDDDGPLIVHLFRERGRMPIALLESYHAIS